MFGYNPIAFSVPTATKSPDQLADERCDKQADAASPERSHAPAERFVNCNAVLTFETTRHSWHPSFVRGVNETAVAFADRVRDELLKLQGVKL